MARTLAQIIDVIKTRARTFPSLDNLLFSDDPGALQGASFMSLVETVGAAQLTFELITDQERENLQTIADTAPSGNAAWIRARILDFQFGDVVQIDPVTFVVSYAIIDPAKQIITQASVSVANAQTDPVVQVKIAKGANPPEPLSAVELTALQDYYFGTGTQQGVGFAGVRTAFVSQDPDRISITGTIIYLGQFVADTVKANVIAAIESFLASFQNESFNGTIRMQRLEDAILAVEGVSRFVFTSIRVRDFNTLLGSATVISPDGQYLTAAGYIISEDTANDTLNDTISTELETTL